MAEISPRLVQAHIHWALHNAAGERLYDFEAIYTVIRSDGALHITAIAHNELPQYQACLARLRRQLELEEERERLKQALILAVLVIFGLAFGFALINIFLVALFWEHGWIAAIGVLALLYFGIAFGAALKLRSAILRRSGLFPATLAELGKDCEQLRKSLRE